MPNPEPAVEYARQRCLADLHELKEFLSFPTISALPEHETDIREAAGWLSSRLRRLEADEVEIMETGGHPLVYAEWARAEEKRIAEEQRRKLEEEELALAKKLADEQEAERIRLEEEPCCFCLTTPKH